MFSRWATALSTGERVTLCLSTTREWCHLYSWEASVFKEEIIQVDISCFAMTFKSCRFEKNTYCHCGPSHCKSYWMVSQSHFFHWKVGTSLWTRAMLLLLLLSRKTSHWKESSLPHTHNYVCAWLCCNSVTSIGIFKRISLSKDIMWLSRKTVKVYRIWFVPDGH